MTLLLFNYFSLEFIKKSFIASVTVLLQNGNNLSKHWQEKYVYI